MKNFDVHAEVEEVFSEDDTEIKQIQLPQERVNKRRQVEDMLDKKRLKEELEDY